MWLLTGFFIDETLQFTAFSLAYDVSWSSAKRAVRVETVKKITITKYSFS